MDWAWHELKDMVPVLLCVGGVLLMMLGLFNHVPGRSGRGRLARAMLAGGLLMLMFGLFNLIFNLMARP